MTRINAYLIAVALGLSPIASSAHAQSAAAVLGPAALAVTPRIGHIHVVVDGAPWHWADASGEPLILVGLPAGRHTVEIIPANANHQPLDCQTLSFIVPPTK